MNIETLLEEILLEDTRETKHLFGVFSSVY